MVDHPVFFEMHASLSGLFVLLILCIVPLIVLLLTTIFNFDEPESPVRRRNSPDARLRRDREEYRLPLRFKDRPQIANDHMPDLRRRHSDRAPSVEGDDDYLSRSSGSVPSLLSSSGEGRQDPDEDVPYLELGTPHRHPPHNEAQASSPSAHMPRRSTSHEHNRTINAVEEINEDSYSANYEANPETGPHREVTHETSSQQQPEIEESDDPSIVTPRSSTDSAQHQTSQPLLPPHPDAPSILPRPGTNNNSNLHHRSVPLPPPAWALTERRPSDASSTSSIPSVPSLVSDHGSVDDDDLDADLPEIADHTTANEYHITEEEQAAAIVRKINEFQEYIDTATNAPHPTNNNNNNINADGFDVFNHTADNTSYNDKDVHNNSVPPTDVAAWETAQLRFGRQFYEDTGLSPWRTVYLPGNPGTPGLGWDDSHASMVDVVPGDVDEAMVERVEGIMRRRAW